MGGRALALNIVLVRQGTKFVPGYVKLFDGLDPVTLTDREDTPGRTRPLRHSWPGWWSKMELFSPENADLRPCLFFDLDTYVLGDIGDMMVPFEGLGMLRDFNIPDRPASGVMFIPEDASRIWKRWSASPKAWMRDFERKGDQGFLGQFCDWFIQDRFEGVCSYKRDAREAPAGRIVCFHGKPNPPEADGWAAEHWSRHAVA